MGRLSHRRSARRNPTAAENARSRIRLTNWDALQLASAVNKGISVGFVGDALSIGPWGVQGSNFISGTGCQTERYKLENPPSVCGGFSQDAGFR